jgi:hypothetical protein
MPVIAKIGDTIESQCGRCHDSTPHTVLTQDDKGRAARCECDVCHGKHLWRKPRGKEDPNRKRKTPEEKAAEAAEKAANEARAAFEAVWAETDGQESAAYNIRASFEHAQRVSHKKFGDGVVIEVLPPGRMEVRFVDGVRSLVMNR